MTLTAAELEAVAVWATKARPRQGIFYRSVSYKYMDPETVLDGAGTESSGGRFASIGTKAVYLSESDSVASSEVTARKKRLGGNAQISTDKYPRVIFRVRFDLKKVLDFSEKPLPRGLAALRNKCLEVNDLTVSQNVGDALQSHGVEGLIFPSAVGSGTNLVVYRECCADNALELANKSALLALLKEIASKVK